MLKNFSAMVAALAVTFVATAEPFQWPKSEGGNGHWYEVVFFESLSIESSTWEHGRILAAARGGYLATIRSDAENAFVTGLIKSPVFWRFYPGSSWNRDSWDGPWIGGYQPEDSPEPLDGWRWTNGEPFDYSGWHPEQPDDFFGGAQQNRLHYWADGAVGFDQIVPAWDDVGAHAYHIPSYVVEYNVHPNLLPLPPPAIEISGRDQIVTRRELREVRGWAKGFIEQVWLRTGARAYRPINLTGLSEGELLRWSHKLRLRQGRNRVDAFAVDALGQTSQVDSVTIVVANSRDKRKARAGN